MGACGAALPWLRTAGLQSADAMYFRAIAHQPVTDAGASVEPAYTQTFQGLYMTSKTFRQSSI